MLATPVRLVTDPPWEGRPDPGRGLRPDTGPGAGAAVVAHELRGALGAVLYALELIPAETGSVAGRARSVAARQARHAARVVDDLFDLAAGSLGKLALRREPVDLAGVVADAADAAGHLVAARGHRLTVSLPAVSVPVLADPARLGQVVTNLLANAAKFTDPDGRIDVSVEASGGWAVLRVRDDGRGIAPHLLPRVFDAYAQGVAPGGERPAGLGLGLGLVKTLVELHGGTVTAASAGVGRGAEFVVRLPRRPTAA